MAKKKAPKGPQIRYIVQTTHSKPFHEWFEVFRKDVLRISTKKWRREWRTLGIRWTNYPPNKVTLQFKSKRRANRIAKHFSTDVKAVTLREV